MVILFLCGVVVKDLVDVKRVLRKQKQELRRDYGVEEIGVFGSFVRGEQKRGSDVDIFVEFSKTPDLFKLIGLEEKLGHTLDMKVDLVRKAGIRPELKKDILSEAVII